MTILVILIPAVAGILSTLLPFRKRIHWEIFLECAVILNSILVWYLLLHHPNSTFLLAHFTGDLSICFKVDGMGMTFAGLVVAFCHTVRL